MKKRAAIIIMVSAFSLGLSACNSTSEDKIAIDTINEIINYQTEEIEFANEHVTELSEANNNIDFTYTQVISSTLPPLTFHILGETFGQKPYEQSLRVKIDSIHVIDADGKVIQEIDSISAYPRNASEHNLYGLEFGDYNFDGYLDMSIRRFPGESDHDRTHFYWLWDSESWQFVYDWKLSEVVTEENFIDYTVTQSINDEIPPFTFRLLGRWVEGWSSNIQDIADNLDANIHVIQIIDSNNRIIQEFDGLTAHPPRFADSFGLHFADYNFDGFLDMALYASEGGSMHNAPHIYWLWDNSLGQFVENLELIEISDSSTISINAEEGQLECYARMNTGMGITQSFKYIDGRYIFIYSIEWGYKQAPDKEDEYIRYEIIKELIDGEIIISENYYKD